MGKYSLPLGFRFHPTDVELVKYYLKRKILGKKFPFEAIAEIDIYKHAPWDLSDMSFLKTGDLKWFFFCPIEKKYARGVRFNRGTVYGYWKTTGKDRPVRHNDEVVGMIKTLIFHQGKAPHGDRTDWVMHEYRLEEKELAHKEVTRDAYVLCVVFKKEGMGPRNGAQYGAPFKEEDWSDDEEGSNLAGPSCMSTLAHVPQSVCTETSVESSGLYTQPLPVNTNAIASVTADSGSIVPLPMITTKTNVALTCMDAPQVSMAVPTMAVQAVADAQAVPVVVDADAVPMVAAAPVLMEAPQPTAQVSHVQDSNDDIASMLDIFTEDEAFVYDNGPVTANAYGSFFDDIQGCAAADEMATMLAYFGEDHTWNNLFYPSE